LLPPDWVTATGTLRRPAGGDLDICFQRPARRQRRSRGHRGRTSIAKESPDSPRKIDAAVCAIGARMVRRPVLASPAWAKHQRNGCGRLRPDGPTARSGAHIHHPEGACWARAGWATEVLWRGTEPCQLHRGDRSHAAVGRNVHFMHGYRADSMHEHLWRDFS